MRVLNGFYRVVRFVLNVLELCFRVHWGSWFQVLVSCVLAAKVYGVLILGARFLGLPLFRV